MSPLMDRVHNRISQLSSTLSEYWHSVGERMHIKVTPVFVQFFKQMDALISVKESPILLTPKKRELIPMMRKQ